MDAGSEKYLEENVGGVLAQALAEMAVAQPKDGVGFLSSWLKSYSEVTRAKTACEQEDMALEEERALTRAKLDEREEKRQQQLAETQHLDSIYTGLLDNFSNPETVFKDQDWQELVNVAQVTCEAKSAYLATLEQGEEGGFAGPYLSYEYAAKGAEEIIQLTLPQGTGITWGALTENPADESFKEMCLWKPPSVEAAPVEPVEGEEPPPEKPSNPYYPVLVQCVTDVPTMHYFEMTRLGAYLAVPLVYQSYYSLDALADAKLFEEEKKAEALKRAEEEAARAAAAEAGEVPEGGEAPAEAAEPVEEKQMVLRGTEVKMVLCLDTLGANTSLDEANVMKVLELVKACGQCKSATEFRQVDEQVLSGMDADLRAQQEQQITDAMTAIDEKFAEQLEAEDADCPEEKKDLLQKKWAFLKALELGKELESMISALFVWVVATPEMMSIIAAAAFTAGYPRDEIYPRRKTVLSWEKLKTFIAKPLELISRLEKVEYEGARKGLEPDQKQSFLRSMATPAEMDADKAKEIAPAFMLIFNLMQAALAYRAADLEMRKAEWNKQVKEKEEAGEEYAGPEIPPLEELDDDFIEAN